MIADVYNKEHKKVGTTELPKVVFETKWNQALVHRAIIAQLANRRRPIAHTKDRSEVRGGGKKPYAQKHTGQSRAGSKRSPLWSGGGTTFGPRNERDFSQKINKKMRRIALWSLIAEKQRVGDVSIIDTLELKEQKTKLVADIILKFFNKKESMLFVPSREHMSFSRAGKNIPKTIISAVSGLNVYDCATHRRIIFEKDALLEFSQPQENNKK